MKSYIDVTIITLNYKEALMTSVLVKQLLNQKNIKTEIIIIDNSCDQKNRLKLLSLVSSNVRIIVNEKNIGCGRGYNLGILNARGKYIFILNNDTSLEDRLALKKMKNYLDHHPDIAILQPKIKSWKNKKFLEYAGASGGYIDMLGYPFCRGRIFDTIEKDKGQYDDIYNISWASTCAFFAKKDILLKLDLFDPIYFAYAEEVDICIKAWNEGYRVVSYPKVCIYHQGETSWKKARGRKTFLIHKNHLILYFKCFPVWYILFNLPYRILLDYASMIIYFRHRSNLHIIPVLMSHISFLLIFPKIIFSRRKYFRNNSEYKPPIYLGSIVFDYYIRKISIFSDLKKEKFINL